MKYDPDKHQRRSIRLKEYDYTQEGAYFVTVCLDKNHKFEFGEIADGVVRLNQYGMIVQNSWDNLTGHYSHIELDAFVVMPNHAHGIILLADANVGAGLKPALGAVNHDVTGAGLKPAPTIKQHGLPEIMRAFKTFSARSINKLRRTIGKPIWQRNYYEHIIRSEKSLN